MKNLILFFLTIALPAVFFSDLAAAHGRIDRFNFGIHLGYPGYYGYYGYSYYDPFFYSPFYSYPPVIVPTPPIVVPTTPPVYIQQQEESTTVQTETHYWYYCQDPEGYYPYVKQCPGGWLRVAPQPHTQ